MYLLALPPSLPISASCLVIRSLLFSSVVDPRDRSVLATALSQVFANNKEIDDAEPESGTLANLRVCVRGNTFGASMTMGLGQQGLIVVTRLHDIC